MTRLDSRIIPDSGQRGTVAVEFVLVLPILLILLFGIVELGHAWYCQQMLVTASRQGARLGSVLDGDDSITIDSVKIYVEGILSEIDYPFPFVVHAPVGVEGAPGDSVTVTVTSGYVFPVLGGLVGLDPITLTGTTVMRHE